MFNDSFDQLWDDYYAPKLGKWETNQFRQACRRSSSDFLETIIKPMAYVPADGSYLSISPSMESAGRAHFDARDLIVSGATEVQWATHQFFTNAMRIAQPTDVDFHSPSDRIITAPYHVFTFEYDSSSLPFFQQQLSWFRTPNNLLDAPIGKFLKDLRAQFKDCVGLSVVYSGNKSFHYHLIFSTELVKARVPDITSARYGFTEAWTKLAQIMKASPHLNIPADMEPDGTTRFPEWFRRLPNGVRTLRAPKDKPNWSQFFGVPVGDIVPQLVMWEHLALCRAGRGEDQASVFEPANFTLAVIPHHSRKSAQVPVEFASSTPIQMFCGDKLRAIYPGDTVWPRFEGFVHHRGELRALFANSHTDKHPASYMGQKFATVFIQGDNPFGLTTKRDSFNPPMPRLPRPLGEMIELWTAEFNALANPAPDAVALADQRARTPLEQQFADQATDHDSATKAIAGVLDTLILGDVDRKETHFLSAPEGISKTRSLIASTPRYHYNMALGYHPYVGERPQFVMYAFDSYEMAAEKCAEFNAEQPTATLFDTRFKGVVLPSFTHLYEEACEKLTVTEITTADAAGYGFPSMIAAIEAIQPEVIDYFRNFYDRMWVGIGSAQPVLFCVHQVAHGWIKNSPTRLMFSPLYWKPSPNEDPQAKNLRHRQCRNDTKIGLLIHDEVSAEKLVLAVPADLVVWVEMMKQSHPSVWSGTRLDEQFEAFDQFTAAVPPPLPITYERAAEIAEVDDWEMVTTAYSGEYGPQEDRINTKTGEVHAPIYGALAGKNWCMSPRKWPTQAAHKTIVLTTESVPAAIVRKLATDWTVTELDTPLIPRDVVDTYVSKDVISSNLGKLVKAEQQAFFAATGRKLMAISNKAKHVVNTKTHASAKGSNNYMGQDVVQTMSMMAPEQYELHEALNAWTGRTDLVLTRHIDEFNQTAGRNLGFRKRGDPKHILLLNGTLSKCLDGEPKARARYIMQEVVTRRQAAAAKQPTPPPHVSKPTMAAIRAKLMENVRPQKDIAKPVSPPRQATVTTTMAEPVISPATPTVMDQPTARQLFQAKMDAWKAGKPI